MCFWLFDIIFRPKCVSFRLHYPSIITGFVTLKTQNSMKKRGKLYGMSVMKCAFLSVVTGDIKKHIILQTFRTVYLFFSGKSAFEKSRIQLWFRGNVTEMKHILDEKKVSQQSKTHIILQAFRTVCLFFSGNSAFEKSRIRLWFRGNVPKRNTFWTKQI